MKNISITYSGIMERCKMLSAFEGRTAKSGSGETLFIEVALTDNEKSLMSAWIGQGLKLIEATLAGALNMEIEFGKVGATDEDKADLVFFADKESAISVSGSIGNSISETLVVYVLHLWLADKLPDRSTAYKTIFNEMLEATRRIAWKKKRPTMEEN